MRAIRVSDIEAKLILSMKELNEVYIYSKRHFICGALISSLRDHLKLKSIETTIFNPLFEYSDAFDWGVTTKSFHNGWVRYLGSDHTNWDSYFEDWNDGTKYSVHGYHGAFDSDSNTYRNWVLGECAKADPKYEFCIDMKIIPEYFNGAIQFEVE